MFWTVGNHLFKHIGPRGAQITGSDMWNNTVCIQSRSTAKYLWISFVWWFGQVTFYCESVHQPKKFDLFRQTIFPHERMGSGLETNPPTVTDDKFASPSPNWEWKYSVQKSVIFQKLITKILLLFKWKEKAQHERINGSEWCACLVQTPHPSSRSRKGLGNSLSHKYLAGMSQFLKKPANTLFRTSMWLVRYYSNFQNFYLYRIFTFCRLGVTRSILTRWKEAFLALVELEHWLPDVAFFPLTAAFQHSRHYWASPDPSSRSQKGQGFRLMSGKPYCSVPCHKSHQAS